MGSYSKAWVDGPFELVSPEKTGDKKEKRATGARRLAAEMTLVHNCIIRGINAVYLQCLNVSKRGTAEDKLDFANFASQWAEFVNEHHTMEETSIFPGIGEITGVPGLMDGNVDEHKAFHNGLEQYVEYLEKVKKKEETFDGEKLKSIIDGFMPILRTHLANEIDTLLLLTEYEDKVDWIEWFEKQVGEKIGAMMKNAEYRTNIFPISIIFHDKTSYDGVWANFPPIPWLFALALRWLYMNKHKNWWRFAGCDYTSQPKELPFA